MVMVTVTAVLKFFSLFVAELISSITDWFQTKPAWAKLEVLEDTELKTTGGGKAGNSTNSSCLTFYVLFIATKVAFLLVNVGSRKVFSLYIQQEHLRLNFISMNHDSLIGVVTVRNRYFKIISSKNIKYYSFPTCLREHNKCVDSLPLSVHERHKAKTLWEKTGAVVMVVRRPG